jgi:5,10-methylene-tetrahydrofolate dehydrogenase/methenyl tetrahydrofolate cyclohydrolase
MPAVAGVIKTLPTLPPSPVPKPSGNAAILDGRSVASEWQAELKVEAAAVSERLGRQPRLRVILVGNRPDSCLYVYRKLERCREVGVEADVQHMATKATQEELMEAIRWVDRTAVIPFHCRVH